MRFVLALLAVASLPGCLGHVAVSPAHAGHGRIVHQRGFTGGPVHRGLSGTWGRVARGHRGGQVQSFFVLGRDGRWKAGRRTSRGFFLDGRGRWRVHNGALFLDSGHGFRPFARVHVSGRTMLLTLSNGRRQRWHRH